jgi:dihydrofolate synthase/folylpolyglutamate synthase
MARRTPRDSQIRAWLEAHVNLERGIGRPAHVARAEAPTLERIQELTTLLGSPQLDVPTVHITGTNGKTSTVRMVAELLRAHGSKVGAYTSPNLERINDRMSIDGVEVDDDTFDELLRTVQRAEPHMTEPPSYFEILTAAALYWFSDEAVDAAVIEVGLGGTWDATNVVDADVAVVTNVALDHVEYLGPTRESIATDKAGIITPMSSLALGETDPELVEIFAARDPQQLLLRGRDFDIAANRLAVGGRAVDIYTPRARYDDVFLSLHGAHQADNAALALAAAELFVDAPIDDAVVREAYATATSPGRMEFVARQPLVILDGAHNVAGARALRDALDEELGPMPRTLVIGLLREKDPAEMLGAFGLDGTQRIIVCRPPSPRAHDPAEVAKAAEAMGFDPEAIDIVDEVRAAVGTALLETPDEGQLVITGSLYVVGEARSIFVN